MLADLGRLLDDHPDAEMLAGSRHECEVASALD